MPAVIVSVVDSISCPLPGNTRSGSNPEYCCMASGANHMLTEGLECIASSRTACRWLKRQTSNKCFKWQNCRAYDKRVAFQLATCPTLVVMCDSICSIHRGSKCEASNRGLCCRSSTPKTVRPAVLWGTCAESNPV